MIELKLVSSLEKVFPDEGPKGEIGTLQGLLNERVSFQASWRDTDVSVCYCTVKVVSPIAEHIKMYHVLGVPVTYACQQDADDDYLRKTPGVYPDILATVEKERMHIYGGHWETAWFDIDAPETLSAGDYPVKVQIFDGENLLAEAETVYHRIGAMLPKQTLIHTHWFHPDALCNYYRVKMFSEEFWDICGKFLAGMKEIGQNCVLTPIHTPPLDTLVGGERLTCQLVKIKKTEVGYKFDFSLFERFIALAQSSGIEYFEMAHLFTQWGAAHCPKIIAEVDGAETRIFGWETDATDPAYTEFLHAYLPAVIAETKKLGIADKCMYHISDEPNEWCLDAYMAARNSISDITKDLYMIDALSHVEYYEKGAVAHPVPANNAIKPFLAANIENLWTYYCVGQYKDVSNHFIAMPARRTRILGCQLFKYNIAGFLQWAYNFYGCRFSEYPVDPYRQNDGDGFTPAGDSFIVYPGRDGAPVHSIRGRVFKQGIDDMRALQLLESFVGHEEAVRIMEDGQTVEFDVYPRTDEYLIKMRERVNREIEKRI